MTPLEAARIAHQEGRLKEAETAYHAAWRQAPADPAPAHLLGLLYLQKKDPKAAITVLRHAARLAPGHAMIHATLAQAYLDGHRWQEAEGPFRTAFNLDPSRVENAIGLAALLNQAGRSQEALAFMEAVAAANPDHETACEALGTLYAATGALEDAAVYLTRAVDRQPDNPDFLLALAAIWKDLGRPQDAEPLLRRALAIRPDHAATAFNLGYVLLLRGATREGYALYEARWRRDGRQPRPFLCPLWNGQDIEGKTLLLWAEQGMGDTLQFARYLPVLARALRIVVEADPPLVRLLEAIPGLQAVIPRGAALPHYDFHCPMLSLPHVLGDPDILRASPVPYLSAPAARIAHWQARLHRETGQEPAAARIGLCWAGSIKPGNQEHQRWNVQRSLSLAAFAAFAQLPRALFVSLQKGPAGLEAGNPPAGLRLIDPAPELADFQDTAALIMALDLVVTVDTAVAHLAGALGKPVLMLNRFTTDWRWGMHGERTAWYPSMRILRQPAQGDWAAVLGQARSLLTDFLAAFPSGPPSRRAASGRSA